MLRLPATLISEHPMRRRAAIEGPLGVVSADESTGATERVAFGEEGAHGSAVRLIVRGDLDASLLGALEGFIRRQRSRSSAEDIDGEWAE